MGTDGFLVLSLPLVPNLFFTTQLYIKRHINTKDFVKEYPTGRTLFITFPGESLDKNSLEDILSQFVTIESIDLVVKRQKKGFIEKINTLCHVVLPTESHLEKIISLCTKPFIDNINTLALSKPLKYGYKNCIDYKLLYKSFVEKPDNMSKKVDEYMAKYDVIKEIERKIAKEAIIDEDGFVKVISGPKIRKCDVNKSGFNDFYKFQNKKPNIKL